MFSIRSFIFSLQRYNHIRFNCVTFIYTYFHHFCTSNLKSTQGLLDVRIANSRNFQLNRTSLFWYSSKPPTRFFRAYRKRVNRRLRLAQKPILNEARFQKAISQLPARFNSDDLHDVISSENDPLVCLELFTWASKQHRFKHSTKTYHVTIQKLGINGMIEEMYEIVDQLLTLPDFGSKALYNTIIYYFTQARKLSRAITVFKHMKKTKSLDSKPSNKTYNLLFAAFLSRRTDTYINHWYMGTMECLFRQMINDGIEPDIFSLNSMVQGYVLSNHVNDALRIFHQMGVIYRCAPNSVTYDQLIHGLCAQTRTRNARDLLVQMKEKGFYASDRTYNSLVSALAIGGELEEARNLLWEMSENRTKVDFITYKTLVDEFCRKGKVREGSDLVKDLKEKQVVDESTYKKLLLVIKGVRYVDRE